MKMISTKTISTKATFPQNKIYLGLPFPTKEQAQRKSTKPKEGSIRAQIKEDSILKDKHHGSIGLRDNSPQRDLSQIIVTDEGVSTRKYCQSKYETHPQMLIPKPICRALVVMF